MSLVVAASGDHLIRGTSPFIVCADTVWSAFADAGPTEFRGYLRQRASQGFNALLVSVLPIVHDRSVSEQTRAAFRGGGTLDPGYLDSAVALTAEAAQAGLTPMLVVAWYDYVAGERGCGQSPEHILSDAQMSAYLDAMTSAFAPYDPVYVLSGDETFSGEDPGPYPDLLAAVARRAPGSLITMHTTPDSTMPARLAGSADLSFYSYQSGHHHDQQHLAADLARRYLALPGAKPVMNLEPCYEGHGYGGGAGRYAAADVRRALWRSVFCGASAGLGYGAHGLWQWHRPGGVFNGTAFSGAPFPWDVALEFPGAWQAGLAARLVADHGLYRARPAPDLVGSPMDGVLALAAGDLSTVAVYTPYATGFTVAADLSSRVVTAVDLERGRWFRPRMSVSGGAARIELPDFTGDALYIFTARA
jgi:Protein of unknown function (DUF4038)